MKSISLPNSKTFESESPNQAKMVVEPLYPGYGTTMGNLLRRVMLSSLSGVAVSAIKVEGTEHEFTAIDHVREDITEIIRNVKKIRIKANTEITEPITMSLKATGEMVAKVSDLDVPGDVEAVNKDQVIATLTDAAAKLEMTFKISAGIGYVGAADQGSDDKDIGWIDTDSIYTPVVNVGMEISNVRVGEMTNFDKLVLDIKTDGTRTPEEAVDEALEIVSEQLAFLKGEHGEAQEVTSDEAEESEEESADEGKSEETSQEEPEKEEASE